MAQIATRIAAFAALFLALNIGCSSAQDRRQNEPGQFDFYVLSLSWSPSFCDAATERSPERAARAQQCGERPFSFVVHGLWPQYEKGFPEFCQNPAPRLDRNIVSSMLDMMPSPRLIFHEWDRHRVRAGPPDGEDSAGLSRSGRTQDGIAEGGRGRLRGGQSGPDPRGHRDRLRYQAAQRSAHLSLQGSQIPQLRR